MSASSQSSADSIDAHEAHDRQKLFIQIAVILGVITALEIAVLFMPVSDPVRIAILAVFSIVKFLMVIFIFMHLRWDRAFCTILFFIGLSLAGGTVAILLNVFRAPDSTPLTSHAAITAPAQMDSVSRTA